MIKNYYSEIGEKKVIHGGKGLIDSKQLFGAEDFQTNLRYVAFTNIPPGGSIGFHEHNNEREELYVIINGTGVMLMDQEHIPVAKGDVIFTPLESSHGLENNSEKDLEVFVFWVEK